jgi:hypothetical protein
MGDLVPFVILVVVAAVGGLRLGMLLSHRLGRLAEGAEDAPDDASDDLDEPGAAAETP